MGAAAAAAAAAAVAAANAAAAAGAGARTAACTGIDKLRTDEMPHNQQVITYPALGNSLFVPSQ